MAIAELQTAPARHPWLAAVVAAPEAELSALVCGYADVAPFGRAEPADAAASLLFGLGDDDPARIAFDKGCIALLESLRAEMLTADAGGFKRLAATLDRLLAVIRRTRPCDTVGDLHRRYAHWFGVTEAAVIDQGLDLRREYWRILALSQDRAGQGLAPRRLMSLWLEICAEAGPSGQFDESYLDVGLTGLRQLPLGDDHDANEEAVCHGLARWAVRQRPTKAAFLTRWREIEAAYPRNPVYWPPLVADVIAAVEDEFRSDKDKATPSFEVAKWWREELELPLPARGRPAPPSGRRRTIAPVPFDMIQRVLQNLNSPVAVLRPQIDRLLARQRHYADATGDVFYLVRTACNVGMQLIERNPTEQAARGEIAATLAREALEYQPADVFAWALWPRALAAQQTYAAAETVGWERIRRFPENLHGRTELATLLSEFLSRPAEAERLLRETITFFPRGAVARAQLATVLADHLDRADDAITVLREAITLIPEHPHSYGQLAILLADRFHDRNGAIQVLLALLHRQPDNSVAQELLARAQSGRRLRAERTQRRPFPASVDTVNLPTARARHALFLVEAGGDSERDAALGEIARILVEDPGLAYARYAAERAGVARASGFGDTMFAVAFERAAREGSAAALRALISRARGVEGYLVRAGITLLTQGSEFEIPAAANDADAGALMRRFAVLVDELPSYETRRDSGPRPYLRLLSDFAAAELSNRLVA